VVSLSPPADPFERPFPQQTGRAFERAETFGGKSRGVSEGTRTPDRLDHNQELYQLSYAHQVG
jgi:hypothetical protein